MYGGTAYIRLVGYRIRCNSARGISEPLGAPQLTAGGIYVRSEMPTDGGIYTEPAQLLAELTRARTAAKFALLDLVDRYQINVARLGAEIAMKQRGKPCRMHGVIILARYQRKFKRYSPSRLIEIITAGAAACRY